MAEIANAAARARLDGLRILLVEDEYLVSIAVTDMLTELGCAAVWHARGVKEALALLRGSRPDVAVLDINLGGELVYPIAAQLGAAGIPFVFATSYGRDRILPPWGDQPIVEKPYDMHALAAALVAALPRR